MRKGVLLCICLLMILLAEPVFAQEKKLNYWKVIEENSSEAIYELEVDKHLAGIIVHLETITDLTYPNSDKIEVFLFNKSTWIRRIEISHQYFEDLNAKQDFIYLINPANKPYYSRVYIHKIQIKLSGGKNPRLVTSNSYIIPIESDAVGTYGDQTYHPIKSGNAWADYDSQKPGFIAYASSRIDICPGFKHERAQIRRDHGIMFRSVRDGIAEISTVIYYGGVGNRVEVFPNPFGVSKTQYQARLEMGLLDRSEGKWLKAPQTIARIENFVSMQELIDIIVEGLIDIGTEAAGEYLGGIAPRAGRVFGVATTAINVVSKVAEFYEQLQVDDIINNVVLLRYPSVHLKKDNPYEIKFSFQAFAEAVCIGAETAARSYVDFCYKNSQPCNYMKTNEYEKKFWNRGIAFYDTLILYRPIPLKYKPLDAKIAEPTKFNWSANDEIYFESRRKGGTKPFSYEWFDYTNDEMVKLSNKSWFKKKLSPGKHHIILKVKDGYGYQVTDDIVVNVIPDKPRLNAEATKKGVDLSWSKYEGLGFNVYQIFGRDINSDHFIYFDSTRNRSETWYELPISAYPFLADYEMCFKVRLITNGIFSESDEVCAKMPIRFKIVESGLDNITISWTSVETKRATLEYSTTPFEYSTSEKIKKLNISARGTKSNYTVTELIPGTTYWFRIKDKNGIYSNTVKAKTLKNFPPHIGAKYTYDYITDKKYVYVAFSSDFYGGEQKNVNITLKAGDVELGKLKITDLTDTIKKIEWDFGDGFKEKSVEFRESFKPGIHTVKVRATDNFGVSSEKSFVINIKSKPRLSEIKVDGEKPYGMYYGKLNVSVDAEDADGEIRSVNFYANTSVKGFIMHKFLGKDTNGFDGWSIKWDTAKIFDEWRQHLELCKWIEIKGQNACYFDVDIYAEVIDNDGLKTGKMKKISILEPLPDLTVNTELERTKLNSELLDEMNIKVPKFKMVNMTVHIDEKGDYRVTGTIKNEGYRTIDTREDVISYQFYMKREIPCPLWYLKALGCISAELPPLEMKVNKTNKMNATSPGFVCPKENIASSGSCIGGLGGGLPTCYCTYEISSGYITGKELKPGEWVQVSGLIPEEELKNFAEEVRWGNTTIGKKVEIIFAIDVDNKILEEDEFNNVVSRDIWIEGKLKLQLIPGGNPESIWYGFGRFVEWLDLAFTLDDKAKFEKELKIASKRLDEAERMLKAGKFGIAANLLKDYSGNMESASKLVDKLPADEKLSQNKVLMIIASSYTNLLKDMYRKEIAAEFEEAINTSLGVQQKTIKKISDAEPMAASMMLQFKSTGLNPDLKILDLSMQKQILEGEEVLISLEVLNIGKAESEFKIIFYEEGNPVKSVEEKICAGCTNNYTLTWIAKRVSEISIGLEEPEDANPEDNYLSVGVEVISPVCYSDEECSDANPCTKDICMAKGTDEARCEHVPITQCEDNDGCCPAGCNVLNDNDCIAECGNNVCEPGEDKCSCPEDCGQCIGRCKQEPCWEWECVNSECQCELQANCCGNQFCEEGEYYLNCETLEFETNCPDCCIIYPVRLDPYPPDAICSCPPGTEKVIINSETGEFICECSPS